jgi:glycosyltransferase involved in cell wall biosynthesis
VTPSRPNNREERFNAAATAATCGAKRLAAAPIAQRPGPERAPGGVAGAAWLRTTARLDRPLELAVVLDLADIGGVEVLLRNLFVHFDPDVVRPRLVCLREAGVLADEFRAAGFPVEVVPRSGPLGIGRLVSLIVTLRRHRVDAVLVTHHHRAALAFGPLAARLARVSVNVVAAHNMDLLSVGGRVLPRWAVAMLRLTDALVLLSPSQGKYLRGEGVGRHWWSRVREVVIANGITVRPPPTEAERASARAALGLDDDEFVVGTVARLSHQKAHHVLFEAVARLARRYTRCRLVLLGDGERRHELQRLANELGISERVVFAGFRPDVAELLPAFDVSCLSSLHEGVPLSVLEAMAACLPVVATDCGSLPDLVTEGQTGYLVPVGDVAGMAHCLSMLADDPNLRARLGTSGRARVLRDFTIENTARRYEALLTGLAVRHGRRR